MCERNFLPKSFTQSHPNEDDAIKCLLAHFWRFILAYASICTNNCSSDKIANRTDRRIDISLIYLTCGNVHGNKNDEQINLLQKPKKKEKLPYHSPGTS